LSDDCIAIAGGSGFIGRAITRRLLKSGGATLRLLTRDPGRARTRLSGERVEFVRADVNHPPSLEAALQGARTVINAVQFEGFPVENPRRGLTFEKVDYGGTVALLEAARQAGAAHFIYLSGVGADESSAHSAYRAKGRAERAIRESSLAYTIFRPSLVYGPEDKVVSAIARALRLTPLFPVPGSGAQKLQPIHVDDVAECVALAVEGRGRNRVIEIGGPDTITFDGLVRLVMEITGRRRPLFHIPAALMLAGGALAQMLPNPPFTREAASFALNDSACDIAPLVEEFGFTPRAVRDGLAYLGER
jgi:nucleoside-diphosphate-sugar epimerase